MLGQNFICTYKGCQRSYCSSFNLKRHLESSHLGVKKYSCPKCDRVLSSRRNLIDHQNIHSGEKPYLCEVSSCGQRFRQLTQYYLHKHLHTELSKNKPVTNSVGNISAAGLMIQLSENALKEAYKIPDYPYSIKDAELPKIEASRQHFKTLAFKS